MLNSSLSHGTYVLLPRDLLRGLFSVYGMDLPDRFARDPQNLEGADTITANLSTISYICKSLLAPLTSFAPTRAL